MKTTRNVYRGPAAVYVVQRFDRRRFKLDWAVNPLKRAKSLSAYISNELDLASSVALWLAACGPPLSQAFASACQTRRQALAEIIAIEVFAAMDSNARDVR